MVKQPEKYEAPPKPPAKPWYEREWYKNSQDRQKREQEERVAALEARAKLAESQSGSAGLSLDDFSNVLEATTGDVDAALNAVDRFQKQTGQKQPDMSGLSDEELAGVAPEKKQGKGFISVGSGPGPRQNPSGVINKVDPITGRKFQMHDIPEENIGASFSFDEATGKAYRRGADGTVTDISDRIFGSGSVPSVQRSEGPGNPQARDAVNKMAQIEPITPASPGQGDPAPAGQKEPSASAGKESPVEANRRRAQAVGETIENVAKAPGEVLGAVSQGVNPSNWADDMTALNKRLGLYPIQRGAEIAIEEGPSILEKLWGGFKNKMARAAMNEYESRLGGRRY